MGVHEIKITLSMKGVGSFSLLSPYLIPSTWNWREGGAGNVNGLTGEIEKGGEENKKRVMAHADSTRAEFNNTGKSHIFNKNTN